MNPETPDTPQENPEINFDNLTESPENAQDAELTALHEQIAALKEQVLRERAENENLRKRFEREKEQALKYGSENLLKDLLPVLDSLTLGIEAAQQSDDEHLRQFIEGSQLTLKMLLETLARHGIIEIDPQGEKFNPDYHEALSAVPHDEAEPNTVLHVTQKGYVLNGRSIRAAQVILARAP